MLETHDTWNLHESVYRITGQPKVMFYRSVSFQVGPVRNCKGNLFQSPQLVEQSQETLGERKSEGEKPLKKDGVPPMHAANPALAIEHATVEVVLSIITRVGSCARHTSNFGLATPFRGRDGTAPLEKHANRLLAS